MSTDQTQIERIQNEAFELLRVHAQLNNADSAAALEEFERRSLRHAEIVAQARLLNRIAPSLKDDKGSVWQALWLRMDVFWARWLEQHIAWALPVVAIVAIFGFGAYQIVLPGPVADLAQVEQGTAPVRHSTRWRETREITLSDGTVAWLDWGSVLSEQFDEGQRLVTLHQGKVSFAVVGNPNRPFVVEAGAVRTQVTGTEFVVGYLTDHDIEVAVIEGQVQVSAGADESKVLDADHAVIATGTRLGEVVPRPRNHILRWRDGVLVYRERRLIEVLQELSAYSRYTLDLSLIEGSAGRVSGVFYRDQAEDGLFTLLEGQDLTFVQSGNTLTIEDSSTIQP